MKNKIRTLFLLMFTSAVSFAQETNQKHVVSKGETITQIAKKYQTTTNDLFLLNPTAVNGINENQVLIIPNKHTIGLQHEVQTQETVYGISKKYNIAIDQLYLYNPGLKENGLKVGQKINITKPQVNNKSTLADSDILFKEIEVKEKETLYSLAAEYKTAISVLYDLNPSLEKEGLKKGTLIKVPINDKQNKLSESKHVTSVTPSYILVESKETIYGISKKHNVSQDDLLKWNPELQNGLKEGMKLYVQKPLREVEVALDPIFDEPVVVKRNNNTIQELTFLLPFNIKEDTFLDRSALNKKLNSDVFLNMTLDFYSGALIAIEDAENKNLPIRVKIVDSKENNRSLNVEALKTEIDFTETDVVIGPFFQKNVDAFSEVFKDQDLMIVSPLSTDAGKPYPNQVHAMPNSNMVKNTMMEYLRSKNGNIIAVINPKSATSKSYFDQNFQEVKQVNVSENGSVNQAAIESKIISGQTNYVILESNSLKTAIEVISNLKKLQKNYDVRLVVIDKNDSLDSTEINMQDLVDLQFTFPSITNESTANVNVGFENAFKKRFKVKPNRFAIRGYDVTMDVITRMMQADDSENIFGYGSEQIENKFMYVNENGGIFNSGIYVLYYDKDLTIKEAQ